MNQKTGSSIFDLDIIRNCEALEQLVFAPSMDSTNDRAAEIIDRGDVVSPMLVLTDKQLAGRGRGSNRWASDQGSLTFSYVIDIEKADLDSKSVPLLPLASGLAVATSVQRLTNANCTIKWPNDVILNEKKIGGVLVESIVRSRPLVVIGIGLNISTTIDDGLLPFAGSLIDSTDMNLDMTTLLTELLLDLRKQLAILAGDSSQFIESLNSHSWLTGKSVRMKQGDRQRNGVVSHIDGKGGLVIKGSAGIDTFYSGQVEQVFD